MAMMARYQLKEAFYTLQGEGARSGRAAVFCRFAGCNLWSGRERDRASAVCTFCDTDFRGTDGVGGGRFLSAETLADHLEELWEAGADSGSASGSSSDSASGSGVVVGSGLDSDSVPGFDSRSGAGSRSSTGYRYLVCTGGEPLLQLDSAAIEALHRRGFEIAVETNGTRPAPPGIDWVCVSPKGRAPLVLTSGDELKLVFPQPEAPPERYSGLAFDQFFLQPMDGPELAANTEQALAYCRAYPQWRLSLQLHKLLGIP